MKQSLNDRRELQRNLKGFITLSKYLLRGSQHEKSAIPDGTPAAGPDNGLTQITSHQHGD